MPVAVAAGALNAALIAALEAGVPLLGGRWFGEGSVPQPPDGQPPIPLPYGTVGGMGETAFGMAGRRASDMAPRIKWFSEESGYGEIYAIWEQVAAALDGRKLTMTNHTQIVGSVQMLPPYRDTEGIANGVAIYTARVLRDGL